MLIKILFLFLLLLLGWGIGLGVHKEYSPLIKPDQNELNQAMLKPLITGFILGVDVLAVLSLLYYIGKDIVC